ncbi:MAG TPA: type III polyketide synthase [Chloroflexota bacterium]|jgi:alkylresorcinol/alkylpyrone synthase|nr:type III polyketide synthase [Chloroflexota bacterium]
MLATLPQIRPAETPAAAPAGPVVAGTATILPDHHYRQEDLFRVFNAIVPNSCLRPGLAERLFEHVGVQERFLALPKERYAALRGFQDRNDAWIEVATELGERAVLSALEDAFVDTEDVAMLMTTTVTGVAVPSLDARLMNRIAFKPSMVRMPLFGLGCLGGAAGLARAADWLRAYPTKCAVLLSVELCSLTFQSDDWSVASAVSAGLFGDGAAAVVIAGAQHPLSRRGRCGAVRPTILGSRSAFFPNTERVMGWDVVDTGFKVVLSTDVPQIVRDHAPAAVDALLTEHGLTQADVNGWVMHPGGPKVIDAMEDSLKLGRGGLAATRDSLARIGNLSSASVLFLLEEHLRTRRPGMPGYGIVMAMGPAFCAEVVLLRFAEEQS